MYLSYTAGRNLYGKLTNNEESANLTLGDSLIAQGIDDMLGNLDWQFLHTSISRTTVAQQQAYNRAVDDDKIVAVTETVSSEIYALDEVATRKRWEMLNQTTQYSDTGSNFFITDSTVEIYPIPSSSGNSITIYYKKDAVMLSVADHTTGNVTDVTNGDQTVTGSGTSWVDSMAGRYIKIDTPSGDGQWYEIDSVTSGTELELKVPYQGTSVAAGTISYTIGEMPVLPPKYHIGPVYYAVWHYYLMSDYPNKADRYQQLYERLKEQMRLDQGSNSTDPSITVDAYTQINNNLTVETIG